MKMINHYKGIAAMMAFTAFMGCASEEAGDASPDGKAIGHEVISLTSTVGMTRTATELQTTQINTSVAVGVFGMGGTTALTNGTNNKYEVDEAGDLTAVDKEMAWPKDATSTVDIYAYAPYQAGWSSNAANTFTVSADQSSNEGYLKSDLIYAAKKEQAFTSSAVALNFQHQLARINVTVKKGEDATYDVSSSAIYITNTKPGTSLNPTTGDLGAASGTATDIKIGSGINIESSVKVYGIIVPQTLSADTKFVKVITKDNKTLTAKLSDNVTFEIGKSYNFTATIGSTGIDLTLGSVTLTGWAAGTDLGTAPTEEVEYEYSPASFVALSSSQSATFADGTYSWTAASNNLMTILEFPLSDGKTLGNFKTLEVTTSNLTENGKWRMGYVIDGTYTNFSGFSTDQTGKTTIDLTTLGIDLSKVEKIQLGGATGKNDSEGQAVNSGSLDISPSDVVLKGLVTSADSESDSSTDTGSDTSTLTATFGTPGGNATYSVPTYTWTATTNNLMTCFEFSNGELANYSTLEFTLSNLTGGGMVRMGYYVGSTFTEFGNGFGSAGKKTVDLTTLGIDLSTVTKISFGGRTGTGSVDIKASEVTLSK